MADGFPRPLSSISSFHAHVYYRTAAEHAQAMRLRQAVSERFAVQLGGVHAVAVGPHACAMYQIAFATPLFGSLVPWLAINRAILSILVHPNTASPVRDHLDAAMWLGPALPVVGERLVGTAPITGAGPPNTSPAIEP